MKLATINLSLYLASSSSAADLPASDAARTLGGKSARKLIAEAAEAEAEVEPPPPRSAAEISSLTSSVKTIFSLEDIKGIASSKSGKSCYTQEWLQTWLQTASEQQADYRGNISVTASGETCQAWSSQTPHRHTRTPGNYPSSGLDANYCRNPDGEPSAWCYTTNSGSRWEYCDVPTSSCSEPAPEYKCGTASVNQADYRGTIARTVSGKTCQAWSSQTPHSHDRTAANYPTAGLWSNYCRNPDGEPSAWCYTTDPSTSYEACDVPTCD